MASPNPHLKEEAHVCLLDLAVLFSGKRKRSAHFAQLLLHSGCGDSPAPHQILKAVSGYALPRALKALEVVVKIVYFELQSANGGLNGDVCGENLLAVYAEMSHA